MKLKCGCGSKSFDKVTGYFENKMIYNECGRILEYEEDSSCSEDEVILKCNNIDVVMFACSKCGTLKILPLK